ncbi:leucine Rich Repeat family protein [Aphelenchoides avenae]|nr:leucine Rich Repeat family protein [Aphelenchus avenae]
MRHAALYLLPLILVVSQFEAKVLAKTASTAPKCPSAELKSCRCGVASSTVSVTCTGDFNLGQLSEAFTGVHIDHLLLSNCTAVDVLAEPLPKLTLRSLQLVNCPISKVHEKSFDSVSEALEELVLSNCSLKQLPFLAKLKQLRTLDLSRNQLENIAERALEGLDQLRRLSLAHNKICSPAS